MVGMTNPLDPGAADSDPRASDGALLRDSGYDLLEEPVHLPTTGLPPSLVGFMVLGAMLLVAVAGFLLLR
jgi:hypothetical protein